LIARFGKGGWDGFESLPYKNVPGSHQGVIRQNLLKEGDPAFEVRYFEVAPGGFTSFEKHQHEHFVVVMTGRGEVRLGTETSEISEKDLIRVGPGVPHQFRNNGNEPLGILCVVDRVRDRPTLIDSAEPEYASNLSQ
jgi:quercetin dioxygenase-like cupin family protein